MSPAILSSCNASRPTIAQPSGNPSEMLKDQARRGVLVERPDRALHAAVGNLAIVAREGSVAVDVEDFLGDRAVGGHEMVGGFHHHHLFAARIDAEVGEEL